MATVKRLSTPYVSEIFNNTQDVKNQNFSRLTYPGAGFI